MRTKWEPVPNEILEYFEQQARKSPEYYNGVVIHDAYKRKQDWKYVRERLLGHLTKEGRLEARRGFQSTTIVEVFMELNAPVALIDDEPVEATDWETVIGWVEANSARLEYDAWALRDGTETCDLEIDPGNGRDPFVAGNGCKPSEVVAAAAAWVRAQKGAPHA